MKDYYSMSITGALASLSSRKNGLSMTEVVHRSGQQNLSVREKKKNSIFYKFIEQFKDLMILILLVSAFISVVIGAFEHSISEIVDGIIIFLIVIMNAIFGVVQEFKAEKSLEALKKLTEPEAVVLRDSKKVKVNVKKLVIGDIVVLESGTIVPADLRLIESVSLAIDESSLTGESFSSNKCASDVFPEGTPLADRHNMAYHGTIVTGGRGLGVVVAVGKETELGKIENAISDAQKEMTPLQKNIKEVGKILTIFVLIAAAVTFFLEVVARPGNVLEAFLTAVAISVAAIPESMPAVITIIMSMGIARLAKQRAIVKRMHSVETLGACQVICSDKTGTITQNKMTVKAVFCDGQMERKKVHNDLFLKALALCNNASLGSGNPTDVALCEFIENCGVQKIQTELNYPRINEIPFDSRRKLMSTINIVEGQKIMFTKGAVDFLLEKCKSINKNGKILPLNQYEKENIMRANGVMAKEALRIIAVAYKPCNDEEEKNLIFLGLVGMIDPPRREIEGAVQKCRQAGMRAIMITGDHKDTALAIARQIGIAKKDNEVMTGTELDGLSDDDLDRVLKNISVFARVSPENKVRIVSAFKRQGKIVAMTGDGVNDAPSLKKADIGIGMGISGTDVTKEVADLIITDDNFATIVVAVEEGRKIYQNIQKTVKFLFSANMGEMLSLFLVTILFPQNVFLLPVQILFVNLITDSLPAIALGVERPEKDLMSLPPRDNKKSLFSDGTGWAIMTLGLIQTLLVIMAYVFGLKFHNQYVASTMAFYTLNIVQMFYLASMRTNGNMFKSNPFQNKFFMLAIAFCFGLLALIAFTPISRMLKLVPLNALEWAIIFGLSLIMMFASELFKYLHKKFAKRKSA